MKKIAVIGLIILVTCSISFPLDSSNLIFGGLFGSGFEISGLFGSKDNNSKSKKDETIFDKQFKTAMGKTLKMDLQIGSTIKITGWDKEEIDAKVYSDGRYAKDCQVDFEENSDGVVINAEYKGGKKSKINSDLRFEIKVPKKFQLNMDTMGGGITISDVEGQISGVTKGGSLSLNNLKGDLSLKTMGGSIELTNSDVDGTVSTMGGNVLISDVKGNVKGSTMGGNVTYKNVTRRDAAEESKEVVISSMGGSIDVDNAPNGANVSTMGGDIEVGSVKQYIKAKTMGGDIKIKEADGSVDATTMGGTIDVKLIAGTNESNHDVKLSSMSGDITLYVPANFSMDVNISSVFEEGQTHEPRIISDFDLNIKTKDLADSDGDRNPDKKQLTGTGSFNGGKNHIQIKNVNGDIYLKKIQ